MKITVIGKSQIHSKKSDRDFVVVNYGFSREGFEGLDTQKMFLDPSKYPLSSIEVTGVYSADFDNRGFLQDIEKISK